MTPAPAPLARLAAKRRKDSDEAGFTLIELMIVLLIIAILLAIAIPTYLGARNRAENRAAQSTLRNAFEASSTVYASQDAYQVPPSQQTTYTSLSAYLTHEEPSIAFKGAAAAVSSTNQVSETHDSQSIALAAFASDGVCWYLIDIKSASDPNLATAGVSNPGTYYGAGKGSSCTATFSAPTSGWQSSFSAATP